MKGFTVAIFAAILCAVSAAPTEINEQLFQYIGQANNPVIVEQYRCIATVFQVVSKEAGLESLWKQYEGRFTDNIKKWEECKNVEGKFAKFFCNLNNGVTAYTLIQAYYTAALEKDPVFYARFAQQYYKTCIKTNPLVSDLLERDTNEVFIGENLKCIVDAIREALDGSPYAEWFRQYEQALLERIQALAACKDLSGAIEVKKCIVKEAYEFSKVLREFYSKLYEINAEQVEKIRKNIQEKCYKPALF